MPIPDNIQREHILEAMLKVHREKVPYARAAHRYVVNYEGVEYPCKLLISWANLYANGEPLDPDPSNFNTYDAQTYLRDKEFNIVDLNTSLTE